MVPKIDLSKDGLRCSRLVQGFWRLASWNKDKREVQALLSYPALSF